MLDGDTYYAYGTGDKGIPMMMSDDLVKWTPLSDALVNSDSYGDHWFWAPEVYKVAEDRYLMFYSAEEHTCVAEATSPRGPFKQVKKETVFPDRMIDSTFFVDDDGKTYMYASRLLVGQGDGGQCIYVTTFDTENLTIDIEKLTRCTVPCDQSWEIDRVNEGPFVFKYNGKYYMTYSGNGYTSQLYGDGVATADSPWGPWTKASYNPVFQLPKNKKLGQLYGVGHSAMFIDKEGKRRIVFHAHKDKNTVHPREMYISTYTINGDGQMVISQDDMFKCEKI